MHFVRASNAFRSLSMHIYYNDWKAGGKLAIYFGLIGLVLGLPAVLYFAEISEERKNKIVLRCSVIAVFLLLALKNETVGSDISGYKEQYMLCKIMPWDNYSYVYYEHGYLFITKLFAKLGFSFQLFTVVIYAFVCMSLYLFIKRYSVNTTMSMLIFVCYQFFVFYISGLRQTIALSVCMLAYLIFDRSNGNKILNTIISVSLVLLASTVHKSALCFLMVYVLSINRIKGILHFFVYVPIVGGLVLFRGQVLEFINELFSYENTSGGIRISGNLIFLIATTLLCIFAAFQLNANKKELYADKYDFKNIVFTADILIFVVTFNIVFSGSTLIRSLMYFTLFLIPGIPLMLSCFERNIRIVMTFLFGMLFIYLFVHDTLLPNQLNLCPYMFFWQ